MKRFLIVLTLLVSTSMGFGALSFEDHFDAGFHPQWSNLMYSSGLSGEVVPAYIESGTAVIETRDQQQNWLTVHDDGTWPYYHLAATIQFTDGFDDAHRAARLRICQDGITNNNGWYAADDEYQVEFSVRDQTLFVVGRRDGSNTVFAQQPFAAHMGMEYRVKIEASATRLKVWLNEVGQPEQLRADVELAAFQFATLLPGGFTIDGSDCRMRVDDVSAQQAIDIPGGLMAYYRLNGDGTDASGNGNHAASFGNVQAVSGGCSGETAMQFDGSSGCLAAPPSSTLLPGSALTMAAWARCDDPSGNMYIIYKATSVPYQNYSLRILENRIQCGFGVVPTHFETAELIQGNDWFHVVAMHDGNNYFVYLNGSLVLEGAATNDMDGDGELLIGKHPFNTNYWDGVIDEVRLYNRILTPAEIAYLSDCPPTYPLPPLLHVDFNGSVMNGGSGANDLYPTDVALSTARGGRLNRAGSFNGSSSHMDVDLTPELASCTAGDHSISAWVFLNSCPQTNVMVVDASAPVVGGDQRGLRFQGSSRPIFKWVTNVSPYLVEASSEVCDGEWHLITGVLEGNQGKIYVDGQLENSLMSSGEPTPIEYFVIGDISSGGVGNHWFNGRLDDVSVFDRALSSEEVLNMAQAPPDVPIPAALPFFDSFNDNIADNWLNLMASTGLHGHVTPITLSDGELILDTRDQQQNWITLPDDGTWPFYTVEADVRVDQLYDDAHGAVRLRFFQGEFNPGESFQPALNEYQVEFSVRDDQIFVVGREEGASQVLFQDEFLMSQGENYHLKASVDEYNMLRVWLNHQNATEIRVATVDLVEEGFDPLAPGSFTLEGADCRLAIDNVSAYATPDHLPIVAEIELLSSTAFRLTWNSDGLSTQYDVEYWNYIHQEWEVLATTDALFLEGVVYDNEVRLLRVKGRN